MSNEAKLAETIEEVYETEYIELSSEEIDLLDETALDQISDFNDREFERYQKDWDHVTGWVQPTRQDLG
jgi:hypothetical protein